MGDARKPLLFAALVIIYILSAALPVFAQADARLTECLKIGDEAARLRCYDAVAGKKAAAPTAAQVSVPAAGAATAPVTGPAPVAATPAMTSTGSPAAAIAAPDVSPSAAAPSTSPSGPVAQAAVPAPAQPAQPVKTGEPSYLTKKWQLDDETRRRRFAISAYRENYILPFAYNYTQDKKTFEEANPGVNVQNAEVKYQLSLKIKLWGDILGSKADLWAGYTQLSLWQFYNVDASCPFRETNYEPEVFFIFPVNKNFLGLKSRYIQFGIDHQSNGRSEPISRSWNRIMANFGFERDIFHVILKTWYRIPESAEDDDNPNMSAYYGYGELWLGAIWKNCSLDLMFRNNLRSHDNRGAIQAQVSFPLIENMSFFVQYFVGYGESLIDYNQFSNRIGVGFILKDW